MATPNREREHNMDDNKGANESSKKRCMVGIIWWAYLITAVLAVPSLSFLLTKIVPVHGVVELLIFVIACWFCTYVGMRLMSNPRLSPPNQKNDQ